VNGKMALWRMGVKEVRMETAPAKRCPCHRTMSHIIQMGEAGRS